MSAPNRTRFLLRVLLPLLGGFLLGCSAEGEDRPEDPDLLCKSGMRIVSCDVSRSEYTVGEPIELTLTLENPTSSALTTMFSLDIRKDGTVVDTTSVEVSVPPGTINSYDLQGAGSTTLGNYVVVAQGPECQCTSAPVEVK